MVTIQCHFLSCDSPGRSGRCGATRISLPRTQTPRAPSSWPTSCVMWCLCSRSPSQVCVLPTDSHLSLTALSLSSSAFYLYLSICQCPLFYLSLSISLFLSPYLSLSLSLSLSLTTPKFHLEALLSDVALQTALYRVNPAPLSLSLPQSSTWRLY